MNARLFVTLAFLGAAFCCLSMVGAEPINTMDSAFFTYGYEFDVDPADPTKIDLDGNTLPDWQNNTLPDLTTTPGIAKFAADVGDGYFCYEGDNTIWSGNATGAYTIEVSVKALTTGTGNSIYSGDVYASSPNANTYACLFYSPLGQKWDIGSPNVIDLGSDVNSDGFHVFRIAKEEGENYWVWRDGVLLNPGGNALPASASYTKRFLGFQEGTSKANGDVDVDYFRFTKGAFAPIPEPSSVVLLLGALALLPVLCRGRRG